MTDDKTRTRKPAELGASSGGDHARDAAGGRAAANVRRLLDDVQQGGEVRIQVVNQANGPYVKVAGLGVDASGYKTVDEAIAAWLDARDFDAQRKAAQ